MVCWALICRIYQAPVQPDLDFVRHKYLITFKIYQTYPEPYLKFVKSVQSNLEWKKKRHKFELLKSNNLSIWWKKLIVPCYLRQSKQELHDEVQFYCVLSIMRSSFMYVRCPWKHILIAMWLSDVRLFWWGWGWGRITINTWILYS